MDAFAGLCSIPVVFRCLDVGTTLRRRWLRSMLLDEAAPGVREVISQLFSSEGIFRFTAVSAEGCRRHSRGRHLSNALWRVGTAGSASRFSEP